MRKIYVFGDSIGQGVLLDGEGQYQLSFRGTVDLLKAAGYPIINYAVNGFTIREGLASFRKKRLQPGAVCVIEFGANDSEPDWDAMSDDPDRFHDGRTPIAEFPEEVARFIREARSGGLEPILATPLPVMSFRYIPWVSRGRRGANILRYYRDDPEGLTRWQERYARVIMETARQNDCPVLDLRNWMVRELDYPLLMCPDGIHPNEAGYALIARKVMAQYPLAADHPGPPCNSSDHPV